ncbi:hypothetical protein [Vagococcus martis]|uniref:hypothetical protein n=1 Tax=Vagococcus martis TaxID=1768210 RepID=UPI0009A2FD13|nr:hypothetical protein [Vagococcus martis]
MKVSIVALIIILLIYIRSRYKKSNKINVIHDINISNEISNETSTDYSPLIDITRILTENDDDVVTSIKLLVNHPERFDYKYDERLEEIGFSTIQHPDLITAYWLTR